MQTVRNLYPTRAKSSTPLRPLRYDGRLTGTVERRSFRHGLGLTPAERVDLDIHRKALEEMLLPASPKEIATELIMPLMALMRGKDAVETAGARAEAYYAGAPLFAVSRLASFSFRIVPASTPALLRRPPNSRGWSEPVPNPIASN